MKEIIRDEKKFYELKEQDLIRLHTRLRLIYECVDNIFMDYADFDPSTIASLADIKNYAIEARDILKVTEGHYTIKKSSVEMSEDEWIKIRNGAMSSEGMEDDKCPVEERLETVKSSLEDAIADVDCSLSDRIDELDEKIAEMYDFYDNFPADWTLEKQLKELAEETVKTAIDPIMKRQTLLKMDIDSLRRDLKLWVAGDEKGSVTIEDRLDKLEKEIAQFANRNDNLHSGINRHMNDLDDSINNIWRVLTELRDNVSKLNAKEYMSATLEETSDESIEDRLSKLEKRMNAVGLRSMTNNNCK